MDVEKILALKSQCPKLCDTCHGHGHCHFDGYRNIMMICACDTTTGSCMWCLAQQMRSDFVPKIYEHYLKMLSTPLQPFDDWNNYQARWEDFVQKQMEELLAVNVKPAKRTPMS